MSSNKIKKKLELLELKLEKVRGVSPLTHGFGTLRYAKASNKWDELAKQRMRLLELLENYKAEE